MLQHLSDLVLAFESGSNTPVSYVWPWLLSRALEKVLATRSEIMVFEHSKKCSRVLATRPEIMVFEYSKKCSRQGLKSWCSSTRKSARDKA